MSCAANAKNNLKMAKSKLFVSEAFANQGTPRSLTSTPRFLRLDRLAGCADARPTSSHPGPYLKRFQPRAKGRAYLILKPTCSITIKMKSHDTSKRSRPPIKLGTH